MTSISHLSLLDFFSRYICNYFPRLYRNHQNPSITIAISKLSAKPAVRVGREVISGNLSTLRNRQIRSRK